MPDTIAKLIRHSWRNRSLYKQQLIFSEAAIEELALARRVIKDLVGEGELAVGVLGDSHALFVRDNLRRACAIGRRFLDGLEL